MGTKIRFFRIQDASSSTKSYAWAAGFGLLETPMPFLHPNQLARAVEFGKKNPRSPGLYIEDYDYGPKARKWPDFLGHGGVTSPSHFVSETVIEDLRANGAPIARVTEMPIAEIQATGLRSIPPPKYFALETVPGIEVDFAASGIPTDSEGKPILNPLPKPWPPIWRLKASSWNGADLFSYSNYGGPLTLICTEKIVELAHKQRWSNCRFEPIWAI